MADFPLRPSSWLRDNSPQQNLPNDSAFGLSFGGGPPFWDVQLQSLDPSNANFSPWDVVTLAGIRLPGLCAVTGKRASRYDIKRVKTKNFATLTKQGLDPADIKIVERIWTPQQLEVLFTIMPSLETPPGAENGLTIQAVSVDHPALQLRGIDTVVIKSISVLHPSAIKGVWEQEIELIEYKPAPPPSQKAGGTASGTAQFARNSPGGKVAQQPPFNLASPGSAPSSP